jgi:ABC-type transport system substrate-binding protein
LRPSLRLCIALRMRSAAATATAARITRDRRGRADQVKRERPPPANSRRACQLDANFDAHREGTFATVHSAAPFYSVLIRVDPYNPSSTTDFVCDQCAAVPQPTDSGRTYTFKIRDGLKFHDSAARPPGSNSGR